MDPVGVAPLGKSLPPGWSIRRTSSGRLFYVNHKSKTTQWNSPDNSQAGEVEEESKNVEEALPKYDLKEFDLPEGWFTAYLNGKLYFANSVTKKASWSDPRRLPQGWSMNIDEKKRVFYVNHYTRTTSWEDPRPPLFSNTGFDLIPVQLRCVGDGLDSTVLLHISARWNVAELQARLKLSLPDVAVKQMLFAGKLLKPNYLLSHYGISKDCVLHVFGNRVLDSEVQKAAPAIASPVKPSASLRAPLQGGLRNLSIVAPQEEQVLKLPKELALGQVLAVTIVTARDLVKADIFGTSDPYCVLAVGNREDPCKTSIKKKNLNPTWNETFLFYLPHTSDGGKTMQPASPSVKLLKARKVNAGAKRVQNVASMEDTLFVLLFDHNILTADDPLGGLEIDLSQVPLDRETERYFSLQGKKSGQVMLRFQRTAITSPEHRDYVWGLIKRCKGAGLKEKYLLKAGVTLRQLLGQEALVFSNYGHKVGKKSKPLAAIGYNKEGKNPALLHMWKLVNRVNFNIQSPFVLRKLSRSLFAQQVVALPTLISRCIWMANVSEVEAFQAVMQCRIPFKSFLASRSGHSIFVIYRRERDALIALLELNQMKMDGVVSFEASFGECISRSHPLLHSLYSGLVCTNSSQQKEMWAKSWVFVTDFDASLNTSHNSLVLLKDLNQDRATTVELGDRCQLTRIGPTSLRVHSKCDEEVIEFVLKDLEGRNPSEFDEFSTLLQRLRNKRRTQQAFDEGDEVRVLVPTNGASSWVPASNASDLEQECSVVGGIVRFRGLCDFEEGVWYGIEAIPLLPNSAKANRADPKLLSPPSSSLKRRPSYAPPPSTLPDCDGSVNGQQYFAPANPDTVCFFSAPENMTLADASLSASSPRRLSWVPQAPENGMKPPEAPLSPPRYFLESKDQNNAKADALLAKSLPIGLVPLSFSAPLPSSHVQMRCFKCGRKKHASLFFSPDGTIDAVSDAASSGNRAKGTLVGNYPAFGAESQLNTPTAKSRMPDGVIFPERFFKPVHCSEVCALLIQKQTCTICLATEVKATARRKEYGKLDALFTTADLMRLLSPNEWKRLSEERSAGLIEGNTVRCKRCQFGFEPAIGIEHANEKDAPTGLKSINDTPLTKSSWFHYCAYRFRCPNCMLEFCRLCRSDPYHIGFDCQDYAQYLKAPKCRNSYSKTIGAASLPKHFVVCNQSECAEKSKLACRKQLKCGHSCCGVKDESECLPCLDETCRSRDPNFGVELDSDCAVCYTDDLGEAPAIQLKCRHMFHYSCILQRIMKGWPAERITFQHIHCPLCNQDVSHPDPGIEKLVTPMLKMRQLIRNSAVERARQEALQVPAGQALEKFAFEHYMFFQCFECKKPYFAGAAECGAQGEGGPVKREELLCTKCQKVKSHETCAKHGSSFLIYKCKFCCSFSQFFCFNTTHFCGPCHQGAVISKLWNFRLKKNAKAIEKYPQCKSLMSRIVELQKTLAFTTLSPDKQHQALAKLTSNAADCPLGLKHPPNGFEFGIGCGLCKDESPASGNAPAGDPVEEWEGMERPMERPNTWEALLFAALQDMGPLDDGFRAGDLNIWSQDPQVFDHMFQDEAQVLASIGITYANEAGGVARIIGLHSSGYSLKSLQKRLVPKVAKCEHFGAQIKGPNPITHKATLNLNVGEYIVKLEGCGNQKGLWYIKCSTNQGRTWDPLKRQASSRTLQEHRESRFEANFPPRHAVVGFHGSVHGDGVCGIGILTLEIWDGYQLR